VKFTKLHEKRLEAASAIYGAFDVYLQFLRDALYWESRGNDVTPMHTFHETIQKEIVFLDDGLAEKVSQYRAELLGFWNETITEKGIASEETRRKLDHEIPQYLPRLRRDINASLDPNYKSPTSGVDRSAPN
jgi:hypothetical protein